MRAALAARAAVPPDADDGRCRARRHGALAACGSPRGTVLPPTAPAATAKAGARTCRDTEKVVNWSNWTQYIDVSEDEKRRPTLDAFTKQTGIKVNYTEDYNDNDEFYAKVRPLLDGRRGHRP